MSMPDIIELANGQKVKGTFSTHEMQRRLSGLRAIMEADSIDAVILTSIHNINYYGDFLYCSFGRQYALVVTPSQSFLITTNIDGGQGWRRSYGAILFTQTGSVIIITGQCVKWFLKIAGGLPLKAIM